MLRRETESKGNVEGVQLFHLVIKPLICAWAKAVSPTETSSQVLNAKAPQQAYGVIEPVILEMKPLADPNIRRVFAEVRERLLWIAIFTN